MVETTSHSANGIHKFFGKFKAVAMPQFIRKRPGPEYRHDQRLFAASLEDVEPIISDPNNLQADEKWEDDEYNTKDDKPGPEYKPLLQPDDPGIAPAGYIYPKAPDYHLNTTPDLRYRNRWHYTASWNFADKANERDRLTKITSHPSAEKRTWVDGKLVVETTKGFVNLPPNTPGCIAIDGNPDELMTIGGWVTPDSVRGLKQGDRYYNLTEQLLDVAFGHPDDTTGELSRPFYVNPLSRNDRSGPAQEGKPNISSSLLTTNIQGQGRGSIAPATQKLDDLGEAQRLQLGQIIGEMTDIVFQFLLSKTEWNLYKFTKMDRNIVCIGSCQVGGRSIQINISSIVNELLETSIGKVQGRWHPDQSDDPELKTCFHLVFNAPLSAADLGRFLLGRPGIEIHIHNTRAVSMIFDGTTPHAGANVEIRDDAIPTLENTIRWVEGIVGSAGRIGFVDYATIGATRRLNDHNIHPPTGFMNAPHIQRHKELQLNFAQHGSPALGTPFQVAEFMARKIAMHAWNLGVITEHLNVDFVKLLEALSINPDLEQGEDSPHHPIFHNHPVLHRDFVMRRRGQLKHLRTMVEKYHIHFRKEDLRIVARKAGDLKDKEIPTLLALYRHAATDKFTPQDCQVYALDPSEDVIICITTQATDKNGKPIFSVALESDISRLLWITEEDFKLNCPLALKELFAHTQMMHALSDKKTLMPLHGGGGSTSFTMDETQEQSVLTDDSNPIIPAISPNDSPSIIPTPTPDNSTPIIPAPPSNDSTSIIPTPTLDNSTPIILAPPSDDSTSIIPTPTPDNSSPVIPTSAPDDSAPIILTPVPDDSTSIIPCPPSDDHSSPHVLDDDMDIDAPLSPNPPNADTNTDDEIAMDVDNEALNQEPEQPVIPKGVTITPRSSFSKNAQDLICSKNVKATLHYLQESVKTLVDSNHAFPPNFRSAFDQIHQLNESNRAEMLDAFDITNKISIAAQSFAFALLGHSRETSLDLSREILRWERLIAYIEVFSWSIIHGPVIARYLFSLHAKGEDFPPSCAKYFDMIDTISKYVEDRRVVLATPLKPKATKKRKRPKAKAPPKSRKAQKRDDDAYSDGEHNNSETEDDEPILSNKGADVLLPPTTLPPPTSGLFGILGSGTKTGKWTVIPVNLLKKKNSDAQVFCFMDLTCKAFFQTTGQQSEVDILIDNLIVKGSIAYSLALACDSHGILLLQEAESLVEKPMHIYSTSSISVSKVAEHLSRDYKAVIAPLVKYFEDLVAAEGVDAADLVEDITALHEEGWKAISTLHNGKEKISKRHLAVSRPIDFLKLQINPSIVSSTSDDATSLVPRLDMLGAICREGLAVIQKQSAVHPMLAEVINARCPFRTNKLIEAGNADHYFPWRTDNEQSVMIQELYDNHKSDDYLLTNLIFFIITGQGPGTKTYRNANKGKLFFKSHQGMVEQYEASVALHDQYDARKKAFEADEKASKEAYKAAVKKAASNGTKKPPRRIVEKWSESPPNHSNGCAWGVYTTSLYLSRNKLGDTKDLWSPEFVEVAKLFVAAARGGKKKSWIDCKEWLTTHATTDGKLMDGFGSESLTIMQMLHTMALLGFCDPPTEDDMVDHIAHNLKKGAAEGFRIMKLLPPLTPEQRDRKGAAPATPHAKIEIRKAIRIVVGHFTKYASDADKKLVKWDQFKYMHAEHWPCKVTRFRRALDPTAEWKKQLTRANRPKEWRAVQEHDGFEAMAKRMTDSAGEYVKGANTIDFDAFPFPLVATKKELLDYVK
ncbi:hypothetical protein C8J56DRAFT_1050885 [Mycena floridula]|nr:hypothetical protein C8J56DRAFT_1050885 [Mycena floridula]